VNDSRASTGVLYSGAEVVTREPRQANAAALAIAGQRILHVGSVAECRAALRSAEVGDSEEIDLGGGCILPGFIDTHLHPIGLVYFDMNADLRGVRSIAALQELLRRAAGRLARGEWLVGLQLEDEALAERRLPTARELDTACPNNPTVVMEHDGHSAVGNSAALAAAGITADTPDPAGGRIARDPHGVPIGPCFESAAQRLFGIVPSPGLERLTPAAHASFARLAAYGITSAGVVLQTDAEGPGGEAGRLESLAMTLLLDQACFSTYAILIGGSVDAAVAARTSPLHDPAAGRRVGGFKIFADGTFGSCTAHMREPFADRPGELGFATLSQDAIFARMREAHRAGLQICVHAIGDAAITDCLALFERLLDEAPRADHRHRIEHASLLPPDLIVRIAKLGLCVSTQPLFIHSEKGWLDRRLGARARYAYPLRALIDAGVMVGGASDAPVESLDVLHAIQCCVTREGFHADQSITAAQAVDLFTRNAAFLQFEEHEKGTLASGKRADLVVLDANPLRVPVERISAIRVRRTVCGGRTTYVSEGDPR
jgi:predicted amidohydrolase YtcJ